MNSCYQSSLAKRVIAHSVIAVLMLQMGPAYAVSANYFGYVSQLPGVYATPPDVNVMFTMDDSGSMLSDAIPDIPGGNQAGMPTNGASNGLGQSNGTYPGMWKSGSSYLTPTYYQSTNKIARYFRSSAGNPLYYDPTVTYLPWPSASNDKTLSPNANVKAVNIHQSDPFDTSYRIDLTVRRPTSGAGSSGADDETKNFWPATYYVYKGTKPLPAGNPDPVVDGVALNTPANFSKYEIKPSVAAYPRAASRSDCSGAVGPTGCTYAQELQNFANWLQYYHSRSLMAKGGVAAAFAKQGTNMRVGFATINSSGTVRKGIAQFSGTNRSDFYTDMYSISPNGGTPLRLAMDNVGKYFQRTGAGNPWAEDPTSNGVGTEYSCRRSFHILSTDGFWNGSGATAPASGNNDSFSGFTPKKPDGTQYAYSNNATSSTDPLVGRFTIFPFSASTSNTLADVAAYYWKTDLRPDLQNRVAPSLRDPAYWQHLTTFTIGLGINGTGMVKRASDGATVVPDSTPSSSPFYPYKGQAWLSNGRLRDLLVSEKTELTWTVPTGDSQETGDDLIHAAMNGRGRYFSATNPTDLANGLAQALSEVADQPLDLASLAADASQVRAGGKLYQATFNPDRWFGRLYAFKQDESTGVVNNRPSTADSPNPSQLWEASNKMPAPADRNIFTSSGSSGSGARFLWGELTSTQQGYLNNDANVLNYLRGDGSKEISNGGTFRDRSRYTLRNASGQLITGGVLGDIVNGTPVKGPDGGGGYEKLPSTDSAASTYTAFRAGSVLENLRKTVFVAANDGMVHAFNVDTGEERFAYVPNAVYNVPRSTAGQLPEKKLLMLADPTYSHRFLVDGPPNVSDAYVDGKWRSVLIGSTGAGARAVYAIDVTEPSVSASNGFSKSNVLWEFSDADSSDMGIVLSYPHIARMRDGSWVALFGNGYDSASGRAKLFLLDMKTGKVKKELYAGTDTNNGLAQPNMVINSKREVIAIYAGDLKGNLWKFDVSDTNPDNWKVAFGGQPLFSTSVSGAGAQPITVMPELVAHPKGGAMVIFGTGKLFEATDTSPDTSKNVNLATQSLYGIWDKPNETTGISGPRGTVLLQQQSLAASGLFGSTTANQPDWDRHRGWYLDLDSGGERANITPQIVNDVVFMVANKPTVDTCSNGGTARIFALDPASGGKLSFNVFADGNVKIDNGGVVTQPLFQLPSKSSGGSSDTPSTTSATHFNRGQLNSSKPGGVDLDLNPREECSELLSYARTDTTIDQSTVTTCSPSVGKKPRVSWRQLK